MIYQEHRVRRIGENCVLERNLALPGSGYIVFRSSSYTGKTVRIRRTGRP
jgi:hypothetical protein